MMDTANTVSFDAVKVKFKGSKLAVGSSKMPSAVVDRVFMETLTALNKSMIEGAAAFVATKKKKKLEDVTDGNQASQRRKIPTRGADVSSRPNLDNGSAANGNFYINHNIDSMNAVDGEDDAHRDHTVGGLRPSQASAPAALLSSFHAVQHNRKQFLKLVDAIDPADMEVTCDYDFWLWLEAQNLFAPFSYKTHDLSVLTLQDIGGAAIRERWYQPPHAVPHPPAAASSSSTTSAAATAGPSSNTSSSSSTSNALINTSAPLQGLHIMSSAEGVARELRDQAVSAHPVEQQGSAVTDRLLWQGSQQAELFLHGCDSSSGGGKSNEGFTGHSGAPFCLHPALENGARNDCNDCYWGSNGAPFPSYSHPVSSNHALLAQSSASTASRHETTAQGIDDFEEDTMNNKNNNPINFLSHINGDSLALHALTAGSAEEAALLGGGPSLDDYIAKLNEELLTEHRHVNTLLTRLRRHTLQGPLARGELEETNRTAERDKTVLARWRKANNSIHNGAGGGNGNGGIGKAKSSHKKKLGTY